MKKEERLLNALNDIDDALIAHAGETIRTSPWERKVALAADEYAGPFPWRPMAALAACLALVVGLLSGGFSGGGLPNTDNGLSYDDYMGPVMPLTLSAAADGLTAERDVTYDFSYYGEIDHDIVRIHADVTDSYTLTNTTDEDMTVEAVYPFKAKLQDKDWLIPAISVDGETAEPELVVGGDLRKGALMDSGEKLIAALEDGSYMAEAFGDAPALDLPCVVYRIGEFQYDGSVGGEITLEFSFHMNPEENRVLMYNIRSFGFKDETDRFSVQTDRLGNLYNGDLYVILLDDDIGEYGLMAYSTSDCKEGSEVSGFSAEVTRTETTLREWMASDVDWEAWKKLYNDGRIQCIADGLTDEALQHYTADHVLTGDAINPIADGRIVMLDDFVSDTLYADRMLYLRFPVTVPAGESVNVTAQSVKYASTTDRGRDESEQGGYDLMTSLGSVLQITKQTVRTVHTDGAELVDNSFGFDWEEGITEVVLDPNVQHYWMKVRAK